MDKINQAFQDYAEQPLDKLDITLKNVTPKDQEIIYRINNKKKIMKDLQLKHLMKRFVTFYENIRDNSNRPEVMNTYIAGSSEENHLKLDITFDYKKYQLAPISYPFLQKPNSIFIKTNYMYLNNWFTSPNTTSNTSNASTTSNTSNASSSSPENSELGQLPTIRECDFGLGVDYNYNKSKQSFSLYNTLFFDHNYEFESLFKMYRSNLDIKRKQKSSILKFILHKNLEERPFIFRGKAGFDRINRLSFELGNKNIDNIIDENSCSPELQVQTPAQDSQLYLRAIYERNQVDFSSLDVLSFKASSGVYKSLNSLFLKTKVFLRKFFFINELVTYQMNMEVGNIVNLNKDAKELKVHELFLNNNFKGVVNPSPKAVVMEGKTGDALGFKNYLLFSHKIILTNLPVFNNFHIMNDGFQISPFFHFNFMLLPDGLRKRKEVGSSEAGDNTNTQANEGSAAGANSEDKPYYMSAGFGINFASESIGCELYYNAYVRKNSCDIGTEFSFNFGID